MFSVGLNAADHDLSTGGEQGCGASATSFRLTINTAAEND
jgi:hypothetical protein